MLNISNPDPRSGFFYSDEIRMQKSSNIVKTASFTMPIKYSLFIMKKS